MAWLFASTSKGSPTFDELLDKCTSDTLPTPSTNTDSIIPDPDALVLSDLIRSAQVTPPIAVKGFKRRLAHHNPNVQLYTLLTLDICIKNGGDAFLREVSGASSSNASGSKDLVDDLAELAHSAHDSNVRSTVLRLVQNWATAFQSKPALAYSKLSLVYTRLRQSGLPFPKIDPSATAAMIDSMAAPEWADATLCSRCRDAFSITNRKHHCRNCGQIFDQKCSSKTLPLPQYGITEEVRVCDGCHKKLTAPAGSTRRASSASLSSSRADNNADLRRASSAHVSSRKSREDAELQLALRLSLAEANPGTSKGDETPRASVRTAAQAAKDMEAEDPDLAAAIAASLRDLPPSAPAPSQPAHTHQGYSVRPSVPTLPSVELETAQLNDLLTFSNAVEQAQRTRQPPQTLLPQAERSRQSGRVLIGHLDSADRRIGYLNEMNAKLVQAIRLYDHQLEQRLSSNKTNGYVPNDGYRQSATAYYSSAPPASEPPRQYASPPPTRPTQESYGYDPQHYAQYSQEPPQQPLSQPTAPVQQISAQNGYAHAQPDMTPSAPSAPYAPTTPHSYSDALPNQQTIASSPRNMPDQKDHQHHAQQQQQQRYASRQTSYHAPPPPQAVFDLPSVPPTTMMPSAPTTQFEDHAREQPQEALLIDL
ncbi:uncharacterized protein L969DRAFT_88785 [Mixia osmundae IAM 14324]|uniref:Vacuolar protein sorting-associated protein 27 n=1 Tax=Mixia osmundae (strain CBS 9802 / IAM 14324 / JCM 22182 / KY 12970) TaxID=764103 RepID=G7E0I1_MIXOS|nr:uncharacterized protein L969DRAFT_88785 [Mixia osmundae IAM 14324]KEI38350.1 hypothetical protein L969DRAFT_88785 [Mixia osmundae IAM 14324]GAA96341.1 hypothetical protein E5Q_03007 [Mixia osmundae IAM 14324]